MASMGGKLGSLTIGLCTAALLAIGIGACPKFLNFAVQPTPSYVFETIQECPRSWKDFFKAREDVVSGVSTSEFIPAGRITEVPEFHDCQKFITSPTSYGPLVAIFAAWELERLPMRLDSAREARRPKPSGAAASSGIVGLAGALIVNFDDPYAVGNFVIERGYSCLYLWRDPTWKARIVPVPSDKLCLEPILPDTFNTTPGVLKVVADIVPGRVDEDYPPVARWDYNRDNRQQYIGIKCGAAWCEIGSSTFVPNAPYTGFTIPGESKVTRVKGWYDEQFLGVEPNPGQQVVPSGVMGTVIPHPNLDIYTAPVFATGFIPVAYVAITGGAGRERDYYKAKLNLDPVPMGTALAELNRIELCHATRAMCGVPANPVCGLTGPNASTTVIWWARITSAVTNTVVYKCVALEDHTGMGFHVVGTARWRWLLKDETTWNRCIEGCCEVDNAMM